MLDLLTRLPSSSRLSRIKKGRDDRTTTTDERKEFPPDDGDDDEDDRPPSSRRHLGHSRSPKSMSRPSGSMVEDAYEVKLSRATPRRMRSANAGSRRSGGGTSGSAGRRRRGRSYDDESASYSSREGVRRPQHRRHYAREASSSGFKKRHVAEPSGRMLTRSASGLHGGGRTRGRSCSFGRRRRRSDASLSGHVDRGRALSRSSKPSPCFQSSRSYNVDMGRPHSLERLARQLDESYSGNLSPRDRDRRQLSRQRPRRRPRREPQQRPQRWGHPHKSRAREPRSKSRPTSESPSPRPWYRNPLRRSSRDASPRREYPNPRRGARNSDPPKPTHSNSDHIPPKRRTGTKSHRSVNDSSDDDDDDDSDNRRNYEDMLTLPNLTRSYSESYQRKGGKHDSVSDIDDGDNDVAVAEIRYYHDASNDCLSDMPDQSHNHGDVRSERTQSVTNDIVNESPSSTHAPPSRKSNDSFSRLRKLAMALREENGIDGNRDAGENIGGQNKKVGRSRSLSKSLNNCAGDYSAYRRASSSGGSMKNVTFEPIMDSVESADESAFAESVTHLIDKNLVESITHLIDKRRSRSGSRSRSQSRSRTDKDYGSGASSSTRTRASSVESPNQLSRGALLEDDCSLGGPSRRNQRVGGARKKVAEALRVAGVDSMKSRRAVKEGGGEGEYDFAVEEGEEEEEGEALRQLMKEILRFVKDQEANADVKDVSNHDKKGKECKDVEEETNFVKRYTDDDHNDYDLHEALRRIRSLQWSNDHKDNNIVEDLNIYDEKGKEHNDAVNLDGDHKASFNLYDLNAYHIVDNIGIVMEDDEDDSFLGQDNSHRSGNDTDVHGASEAVDNLIMPNDCEDDVIEAEAPRLDLTPLLAQFRTVRTHPKKSSSRRGHAELKDDNEGEGSAGSATEALGTVNYPIPIKKGSDSLLAKMSSRLRHAELKIGAGEETAVGSEEGVQGSVKYSHPNKKAPITPLQKLSLSSHADLRDGGDGGEGTLDLVHFQGASTEAQGGNTCHPVFTMKGSLSSLPFPPPPPPHPCQGDIAIESGLKPDKFLDDKEAASVTKKPRITNCMGDLLPPSEETQVIEPTTAMMATAQSLKEKHSPVLILNNLNSQSESSFSDCFQKLNKGDDSKKSRSGEHGNDDEDDASLLQMNSDNESDILGLLFKDANACISPSVLECSATGQSISTLEQQEQGILHLAETTYLPKQRLILKKSHTHPGSSSAYREKKNQDLQQQKRPKNSTRQKKQSKRKDEKEASAAMGKVINNDDVDSSKNLVPKAIEFQNSCDVSPPSPLDPEMLVRYPPPAGSKPPLGSILKSMLKPPPPPPPYPRNCNESLSNQSIKLNQQEQRLHHPPPPPPCPPSMPQRQVSERNINFTSPSTRQGSGNKVDKPSNDTPTAAKLSKHISASSSIPPKPPPRRISRSRSSVASVATATVTAFSRDDVTVRSNYSASVLAASLGSASAYRSNYSSIMSASVGGAALDRRKDGCGGRWKKKSAPSVHKEKKS